MKKRIFLIIIVILFLLSQYSFGELPYDYKIINKKIDILDVQSKIIETEIIGKTEQSKDIKVLKVGTGEVDYLITAGINGQGKTNSSALLWMVDYLVKERSDFLNNVTIHVIPIVNPDRYKFDLDINHFYNIDNNLFNGLKFKEVKYLSEYINKNDFKAYFNILEDGEKIIHSDVNNSNLELLSKVAKTLDYKMISYINKNYTNINKYLKYNFKDMDIFTIKTRNSKSNDLSEKNNVSSVFNEIKDIVYYFHNSYFDNKMENDNKFKLPILMYHHIIKKGDINSSIVKENKFKKDMKYLFDNDYTPVHIIDIYNHLVNGEDLPKKTIIISFDDGYRSNYKLAFPILKKYNFKSEISLLSGYIKERPSGIIERLNLEEIKEMNDSGLINFQNHTWDMHTLNGKAYLNNDKRAKGIKKLKEESLNIYKNRIYIDFDKSNKFIFKVTSDKPYLFVYPYGLYNKTYEKMIKEKGYISSFITKEGFNYIDSKEDLFLLKRYNVSQDLNLKEILK